MKRLAIFLSVLFSIATGYACTSAIISASKTVNGRPLLWKHRDTGEENNKVERVAAENGNYEYVALYNASDSTLAEAWMGFNSQGFAIMNTASYNLKDDNVDPKEMDKEGVVMTIALQKCSTVDDFENLLKTLPKPLGVEANFGVIDALGNGAYFETNNYEYMRFDLKDAPDGILMRTNYSYSGRKNKGMGYIREQNEHALFDSHIRHNDFSPIVFTEEISRTYYHSLLDHDFTHDNIEWFIDQDFIPRRSSTASCCIEGIKDGEKPSCTTMWIALGFPPCAELRAAYLGENGVPEELKGTLDNGHSPLCDETVARKHKVFPIKRGNGKQYFKMSLLYNADGTGYCQKLIPQNIRYYESKIKNR